MLRFSSTLYAFFVLINKTQIRINASLLILKPKLVVDAATGRGMYVVGSRWHEGTMIAMLRQMDSATFGSLDGDMSASVETT